MTLSAKRFPQTRLPVVVYTRQQRTLYTAPVVSGNPRNGPTIQSQAPRILADAGKGSEQHSSNAANHSNHNAVALPYPYASSSTHTASIPLPSSHANPHYLFNPKPSPASSQSKHSSTKRRIKKSPQYQLDVGAYGIPKKASPTSLRHMPSEASLSVGVGEDAYFVRGDAIGVADGVGGWSKVGSSSTSTSLTPSALFAKHIMHYCSAEIHNIRELKPQFSSASTQSPNAPNQLLPSSPFHSPFSSPFYSPLSSQWTPFSTPAPPEPIDELYDMEQQLSDELEELEEGIDVLMILERAYQKTLAVHVTDSAESRQTAPSPASTSVSSPTSSTQPSYHTSWPPSPITSVHSRKNAGSTEKVPLMEGSSTVLLAVLDHIPKGQLEVEVEIQSKTNHLEGLEGPASDELQAVVKLAHVGDCMGMLVRGDEIVWRSEEMWWNFNMPVQLGPLSPITPATIASSAQSFTLPVQADDILILASDGLSDNLWDEDVIDEVNRFRQGGWLGSSSSDTSGHEASTADGLLRRRTLAGMLSEALCSRAKKVSARRRGLAKDSVNSASISRTAIPIDAEDPEEETPFGRRAREAGRYFRGGKRDDISVVVAVISPAKGPVL